MNECIAYLDSEGAWHPVPYEELIRCKDCKYYAKGKIKSYCYFDDDCYVWDDNDFCSRAERKEENE